MAFFTDFSAQSMSFTDIEATYLVGVGMTLGGVLHGVELLFSHLGTFSIFTMWFDILKKPDQNFSPLSCSIREQEGPRLDAKTSEEFPTYCRNIRKLF